VLLILVDVAIAVVALAGLVLVGLRLWRTVRTTTRALGDANERLAAANAALDAVPRPNRPAGRP
jgi:hypothetical protein